MSAPARVLVIGVGNRMRHDDGAGLEVVERARRRLPAAVAVAECGEDATALLDAWEGAEFAVLVDAARWAGAEPGEVAWIPDVDAAPVVLPGWGGALGTHGLGVPEALQLGRALGRLPARLSVLAVALDDPQLGPGLSPRVEAAVDRAAQLLVDRVRSLVAAPLPGEEA